MSLSKGRESWRSRKPFLTETNSTVMNDSVNYPSSFQGQHEPHETIQDGYVSANPTWSSYSYAEGHSVSSSTSIPGLSSALNDLNINLVSEANRKMHGILMRFKDEGHAIPEFDELYDVLRYDYNFSEGLTSRLEKYLIPNLGNPATSLAAS